MSNGESNWNRRIRFSARYLASLLQRCMFIKFVLSKSIEIWKAIDFIIIRFVFVYFVVFNLWLCFHAGLWSNLCDWLLITSAIWFDARSFTQCHAQQTYQRETITHRGQQTRSRTINRRSWYHVFFSNWWTVQYTGNAVPDYYERHGWSQRPSHWHGLAHWNHLWELQIAEKSHSIQWSTLDSAEAIW